MTVNELKGKRAQLIDQAESIFTTAKTENRDVTAEEREKFDRLLADADQAGEDIVRLEKLDQRSRELDKLDHEPIKPDVEDRSGVPGQDQEKRFASFGEQMQAVYNFARSGRLDSRLVRAASGASEGVPADGGFFVQTDFATEVLKRAYETGILASRCRKIPISGNSNGIKINAVDETSRANGSRWGGVQTYWVNEADKFTGSKPKFRQIELKLNKLTALYYATDELLQDASALEGIAMQAFAEEFGFKIDDAIIRGTGAGQPLGILNSGCLVSVAKENGQDADTIVFENILKMWSRLWGRSRQNAVWYISQDCEQQLYSLSLAVGTGGLPVYLPASGAAGSPYATLFGRPVVPIEQADTVGDQGDIMLLDLSEYVLADKGNIQQAMSIHVRFEYDEIVYRMIYRVDGQPVWHSALTPYQSSNTLSPFVVLDAR